MRPACNFAEHKDPRPLAPTDTEVQDAQSARRALRRFRAPGCNPAPKATSIRRAGRSFNPAEPSAMLVFGIVRFFNRAWESSSAGHSPSCWLVTRVGHASFRGQHLMVSGCHKHWSDGMGSLALGRAFAAQQTYAASPMPSSTWADEPAESGSWDCLVRSCGGLLRLQAATRCRRSTSYEGSRRACGRPPPGHVCALSTSPACCPMP